MTEIDSTHRLLDLPIADSIPEFATEHEEAEFWSTHDTSLIFEEAEDVSAGPPPGVDVRLAPDAPKTRKPSPAAIPS
jgi:hypothetical protein